MQKLLLDALQRLTTPGAQTSEGKNTLSLKWAFILVIAASLVQAYCGINPTGASAQILGGLLGLFWNNKVYTNARQQVKDAISKIITLPVIQSVLQGMAQPPKLGAFTPGTDTPTQKLTPEEMGITSLESLKSFSSLKSLPSLQSLESPAPIKIQPRQLPTMPTEQELDTSDPDILASIDEALPNTWVLSVRPSEATVYKRQHFVGKPLLARAAYDAATTAAKDGTRIYLSAPGDPLPLAATN